KQQFISTVSHELRTPLTSINGVLGLAVSGALGELSGSQQRMLQLAQTNCQQLTALVNDLLNVERIASGTLAMQLRPVELQPLLSHCLEQVRLLHPGIKLQFDCPPGLQALVVNADSAHLQHVLQHLLANAVKFSPVGGQVSVSISRHGEQVRIQVEDEGKGVAEHFVPHLFSRFSQADSSDTRTHAGTGLGLAISRSLVSQMHGSMGYKPAQPHGSCFYIDLPYIATLQPQ